MDEFLKSFTKMHKPVKSPNRIGDFTGFRNFLLNAFDFSRINRPIPNAQNKRSPEVMSAPGED
jgi:hypothetical protein